MELQSRLVTALSLAAHDPIEILQAGRSSIRGTQVQQSHCWYSSNQVGILSTKNVGFCSHALFNYNYNKKTRHFNAPKSGRCSEIVTECEPSLSEARVHELIKLGSVYCNNERLQHNVRIKSGSRIRVHASPRRYPAAKVNWESQIMHVDHRAGTHWLLFTTMHAFS